MLKFLGLCSVLLFSGVLISSGEQAAATAKKAPTELTFKAKNGNILFNHAKHAATAKQNCAECHPKFWPQDATAPLNFRPPHKAVEAKHTGCGFCHHEGGRAFQASAPANCKKCHGTAKAAAKKS